MPVKPVKKRELLPDLNGMITKLSTMSGDVAKLELYDNDQARKRVRKILIELKNVDIESFLTKVKGIRSGILEKRAANRQPEEIVNKNEPINNL